MTREFIELSISENEAEKIAWDLYGIKGKAHGLPGESDMNFKIHVSDENVFVMKISRPETSIQYLMFLQQKHLT